MLLFYLLAIINLKLTLKNLTTIKKKRKNVGSHKNVLAVRISNYLTNLILNKSGEFVHPERIKFINTEATYNTYIFVGNFFSAKFIYSRRW